MPAPARFSRRLPSNYDLLSPLADEVGVFLETHLQDDDLAYQALLLVTEAVTNAMEHGNGLDPAKMVELCVDVSERGVKVTVEDEGDGFDPNAMPDAVTENDPLAEGNRGLFLIRTYADDVQFENEGRRIVLTLAAS